MIFLVLKKLLLSLNQNHSLHKCYLKFEIIIKKLQLFYLKNNNYNYEIVIFKLKYYLREIKNFFRSLLLSTSRTPLIRSILCLKQVVSIRFSEEPKTPIFES